MARTKRDGHDLLGHLSATLAQCLAAAGADTRIASGVAIKVFADLKQHFGRTTIYIPSGREPVEQKAAKAHASWCAGMPVRDIARELRCSEQWVYRLLGKELARLQATAGQAGARPPMGESACPAQ